MTNIPDTPYHRAQKAWDDREENKAGQLKLWRIIAFATILCMLVLSLGMVYLMTLRQVETVIVKVDGEGAPIASSLANQSVPGIENIRWFLSQIIINTRSLYQDVIAVKQGWDMAYAYLTPEAQAQMAQIAKEDGIADEIAKIRAGAPDRISRMVEIRSFVPVSDETYTMSWTEKSYNSKGMLSSATNYTGRFTVEFRRPNDTKTAFKNPLGLYVTQLGYYQDIN